MQFRLRTMFLYFVVVWSALAAFGLLGAAAAVVVLLGGIYIHCEELLHRRVAQVIFVLACGLCMLTIVFGCERARLRYRAQHEGATDRPCSDNLRKIALALQQYRRHFGSFPPAYVADKNGRPMHSWRVLILPFLEGRAVYKQYKFNQPWDGPNNRRLLVFHPPEYTCPGDRDASRWSETSYVAVVGPGTAWPGSTGRKSDDLPENAGDTILLVEVAASDIQWMEPRDLTLEEACRGVNRDPPCISSPHVRFGDYVQIESRGAQTAFVDGSVRFVPQDTPPETLKRLFTLDPAKSLDPDSALRARINWSNLVALVLFLASSGMFFVRPREKQPPEPATGAAGDLEDADEEEYTTDSKDAPLSAETETAEGSNHDAIPPEHAVPAVRGPLVVAGGVRYGGSRCLRLGGWLGHLNQSREIRGARGMSCCAARALRGVVHEIAGRPLAARGAVGAWGRPPYVVHEQHETDRPGTARVPPGERLFPAGVPCRQERQADS
jgi:hypothetical protein